MYKFAICDDEAADLVYVKDIVRGWAKANGYAVEIKTFSSAEGFLFGYEEEKDFVLLLLDIEMDKMSGVELAKKVREQDRNIQIVFITGYMDYIFEGYDVEALHYLLKPVKKEKLQQVLSRAMQHIDMQERTLILQMSDETVRLPLYEIKWMEVRKNYVTLYAQKEYCVKRTLREIQRELDERFFQTHRSCIVNMSYIKAISKRDVTLKDGTKIPLARGLYTTINQAFIKYF